MADIFLIVVTAVAFVLLTVVGVYLIVKYQHPDDKNDAYLPKLVVLFGFVLSGATVLMLPLDVANNEGYAGKVLLASCAVVQRPRSTRRGGRLNEHSALQIHQAATDSTLRYAGGLT